MRMCLNVRVVLYSFRIFLVFRSYYNSTQIPYYYNSLEA